jgi:hypothetical protein
MARDVSVSYGLGGLAQDVVRYHAQGFVFSL